MSERPTQNEIEEANTRCAVCSCAPNGCAGCSFKEANSSHAQDTRCKCGSSLTDWAIERGISECSKCYTRPATLLTYEQQAVEIASLKAQLAEAQKVPDGWQLVPVDISECIEFRGSY